MKIKVEENVYIESDSMQFIIKKYSGAVSVNKKTGEKTEVSTNLGYFSTLNAALKHLIQIKLKQSNATTIKELLEDLKRIEKEIDDLIKL